jgi:hypothetical protein
MANQETGTAPEKIPNSTVPEGSTETWKDKKRYLWLWGLMVPGFGIGFALAFIATGWWGFALVGPLLVNGIIPVFDLAFGRDNSNPPDEVIEALENDKYYRWVVFMYIPLMYVVLFGGYDITPRKGYIALESEGSPVLFRQPRPGKHAVAESVTTGQRIPQVHSAPSRWMSTISAPLSLTPEATVSLGPHDNPCGHRGPDANVLAHCQWNDIQRKHGEQPAGTTGPSRTADHRGQRGRRRHRVRLPTSRLRRECCPP